MKEILSTREVARMLNVGPSTVKRWADEGVLPCIRTSGGHRRFRAHDVDKLRAEQSGGSAREASTERWMELLLADNHPQALSAALLDDRAQLGAWWRVADQLGSVLEAIGERWSRGEISVIEEHLMSERLTRALSWVSQAMPVTARAPMALLATAEGDEHTLGLALAELVAREAGWNVRWAGPKTPLKEITRTMSEGDIEMVALSASSVSNSVDLARQARELAGPANEHGVTLVLGGAGAWPAEPEVGRRVATFAAFGELLRALSSQPQSLEAQ